MKSNCESPNYHCRALWVICLALFAIYSAGSLAQSNDYFASIPLGSGMGQIGLVNVPNEECSGPVAMAEAKSGKLALLDGVNEKIVVVDGKSANDVKLPSNLLEPQDIISVKFGYVVAGIDGDFVAVDDDGKILDRVRVKRNVEDGAIRLVFNENSQLSFEDISGKKMTVPIAPDKIGGPLDLSAAAGSAYILKRADSNHVDLVNGPGSALSSFSVASPVRIVAARVLSASRGGALIALQEHRQLPEGASFVRLLKMNAKGEPSSEAYISPDAYGCNMRRPFALLSDGRVVTLSFENREKLIIKVLKFSPPGKTEPIVLGNFSDATLIAQSLDVLKKLEQANGTSDSSAIALSQTSRSQILTRARAALNYKWTLEAENYSHSTVKNLCSPPDSIWKRPPRLDQSLGAEVTGIPYRWGGYVSSLNAFAQSLQQGRLAGSVCTCRNGNCVSPEATGQDCSGFVSYAWQTGKYFTTARAC